MLVLETYLKLNVWEIEKNNKPMVNMGLKHQLEYNLGELKKNSLKTKVKARE